MTYIDKIRPLTKEAYFDTNNNDFFKHDRSKNSSMFLKSTCSEISENSPGNSHVGVLFLVKTTSCRNFAMV